jgi:hypothetical protein
METIGYIAEYYINNIFIGYLPYQYNNEVIGYTGKSVHIAESDIKIKSRKIKAGQAYHRIIYPLQGKINKTAQ